MRVSIAAATPDLKSNVNFSPYAFVVDHSRASGPDGYRLYCVFHHSARDRASEVLRAGG